MKVEPAVDASPGFWNDRSAAPNTALDEWASWEWDEERAWQESADGPELAEVMARIAAVPGPFLDAALDPAALLNDLVVNLGPGRGQQPAGGNFGTVLGDIVRRHPDTATRTGIAVGLWLSGSALLAGGVDWPVSARTMLTASLALGMRLAPVVEPVLWVRDAERREEAARLYLLWSGLRPAGENIETARRILVSLDSAARTETLERAQAELDRKREVIARLADQRAREAVARYSHD